MDQFGQQEILSPQDVIRKEAKENEVDNTILAYGAKQKEYNMYCDHVEPHPRCYSDHKYTVTPLNYYNFLYYQSRRSKYSKNKKGKAFSKVECDKIMNDPTWCAKKPIGWNCLNQYKCGVQEIWDKQKEDGLIKHTKDDLISKSVKELMKIVKTRKVYLKKRILMKRLLPKWLPMLQQKSYLVWRGFYLIKKVILFASAFQLSVIDFAYYRVHLEYYVENPYSLVN